MHRAVPRVWGPTSRNRPTGEACTPSKGQQGALWDRRASPGSSGPPSSWRERALSHGNMNMMSSNENSNCINILSPEVRDFFSECECRALSYKWVDFRKGRKVLKTIFEMSIGFPDLANLRPWTTVYYGRRSGPLFCDMEITQQQQRRQQD